MSFAAKVLSEKSRLYCLQYDIGSKEECYFFLMVDAPKEQAFLRALEQGAPTKIEEFGKVVASGWGAPGAGVREEMTRQYGIEFKAA
jgi:hypothetical protein